MRQAWAWALVLAGVLACGGGGTTPVEDGGGNDGGGNDGGGDPNLPCGGFVTVRLRGAASGALTGFELTTAQLQASAGGPLLVGSPATGPFELVSDTAWAIGKIAPPAGAASVSLSLPIVSARVTGAEGAADLAVCTAPLEFSFHPEQVSHDRCHVIVELDLGRSAVAGSTDFLLPQFKIRF